MDVGAVLLSTTQRIASQSPIDGQNVVTGGGEVIAVVHEIATAGAGQIVSAERGVFAPEAVTSLAEVATIGVQRLLGAHQPDVPIVEESNRCGFEAVVEVVRLTGILEAAAGERTAQLRR